MFIEQLNRKMEEHMIQGLEEEDFVFSYVLAATSLLPFSFIYAQKPQFLFYKTVIPGVGRIYLSLVKFNPIHNTSFGSEIWRVYGYLSPESTKIEFASIGLIYLQILNFQWRKVNIGRLQDLTLKAAIFMLFLILFLVPQLFIML